jgi:plasmid stabilization system protein ParE
VTRVRTSPEADAQAHEADAWWRANRPAAGDRFSEELAGCLALLAEAPATGRRYARRRLPGLRRILLRETRYHAYYLHDEATDEVVVIAIWSAVRGRGPRLNRR